MNVSILATSVLGRLAGSSSRSFGSQDWKGLLVARSADQGLTSARCRQAMFRFIDLAEGRVWICARYAAFIVHKQ